MLVRTVRMGVMAAICAAIIAYPLAIAIAQGGAFSRVVTLVVVTPLLVNVVIRSYAWSQLLSRRGALNWTLTKLGLVDDPPQLLYTEWAVLIASVHVFLPFIVLPLAAAIGSIQPEVMQAARMAGASRLRVFSHRSRPEGHLDAIFALAVKHGKLLDIHLHEGGTMGLFSMEMILDRTRAEGMQGRVTISHAFALGHPDWLVGRMLDDLAEARIHLMSTGPSGWPCPPLLRALDAGITVCSGCDGIRDCWSPYGDADMIDRVIQLGQRNDLDRDADIRRAVEVVTHGGAIVMALPAYGLELGSHADLVLIEGQTLAEAIVSRRPRKLVLKRGRVTARDGIALVEAP